MSLLLLWQLLNMAVVVKGRYIDVTPKPFLLPLADGKTHSISLCGKVVTIHFHVDGINGDHVSKPVLKVPGRFGVGTPVEKFTPSDACDKLPNLFESAASPFNRNNLYLAEVGRMPEIAASMRINIPVSKVHFLILQIANLASFKVSFAPVLEQHVRTCDAGRRIQKLNGGRKCANEKPWTHFCYDHHDPRAALFSAAVRECRRTFSE